MEIDLRWTDLTSIKSIDYNNPVQGVYIWGFMFDKTFVPYYVGNAFNIQNRLTEHISSLLSGRYCIIHSTNLNEFHKYKEVEEPSDEEGLIYIPNYPKGYKIFLEKRGHLQPHINNMIDKMHYSYSVFNDPSITKRKLELIENLCINRIGKEKLWNRRSGNSDSLTTGTITGDKQIVDLF